MRNPRVEGNSGFGLTSAADINDGGQRWKWTYGDPLTRQARGRSPQAEISPAVELPMRCSRMSALPGRSGAVKGRSMATTVDSRSGR